jgi:GH15 family glucan-1,4-alpha-glucosidase
MPWKGISEIIEDKRLIFRFIKIKNKSGKSLKLSLRMHLHNVRKDWDTNFDIEFFGEKPHFIELEPKEMKIYKMLMAYGTSRNEVENLLARMKRADPEIEYEKNRKFWINWIDRGKKIEFKNKEYENMYYRSLLVCKLLSYEKNGAILASPTASFPATPSGSENWDYRFCWIRDAFYVSRALLKNGHYEEVEKILRFFYTVEEKDGHWLPFYTIDGKEPKDEMIVEGMFGPGYEKVTMNNQAKNQLQLDSEAYVVYLTYLYYLFTKDKKFLETHWIRIINATNWTVKNYNKTENGLWELRESVHKGRAHWTYGKVLCYAGLKSAIKISEVIEREIPKEWERAKDILEEQIISKAWSPQRRAFLQTYDKDSSSDISVLAIEDYGLMSAGHPKIRDTVKLIEKKLVTGGGIKRFEDAAFPFYLATLWLAMHFIRVGDVAKAKSYINVALDASTDLNLMAEHFHPNGKQLGNFPQAFCHSFFIEVLLSLKERKYEMLLDVLNLNFKIFVDFLRSVEPQKLVRKLLSE